jgi:hypothetical protein
MCFLQHFTLSSWYRTVVMEMKLVSTVSDFNEITPSKLLRNYIKVKEKFV